MATTPSAQSLNDKTRQILMLLTSLRKAYDSVKEMDDKQALDNRISEHERLIAVSMLTLAITRLEDADRQIYDLPTSIFLNMLDKNMRTKVGTVLRDNMLTHLTRFGAQSWEKIETAFAAQDIPCPLALERFHRAYREELATSAGGIYVKDRPWLYKSASAPPPAA
jgi:hypothetical protein